MFGAALTLCSGSLMAQPEVKPPEVKKKQDAPEEKKAPEAKKQEVKQQEAKEPEKKEPEKKDEPKTEPVVMATAADLDATKALLGDIKVGADTVWVMITGMLVFFMNLGFACVESGMCRAKNCVNILSKNFIVFAVTTIGFWALGWGIMFGSGENDDWYGKTGVAMVKGKDNSPAMTQFQPTLLEDIKKELGVDLSDEKVAAANKDVKKAYDDTLAAWAKVDSNTKDKMEGGKVVLGDDKKPVQEDVSVSFKASAGGKTFEKTYLAKDFYWGDYSAIAWAGVPLWAKFFFQLVFAGTAATIVSGAVAERIKYHAFIIFSLIMAIAIYPIVGHWVWGGGVLQDMGFLDFAGSTQVHSIGGWAALVAVIILGPRIGKYGPNGKVNAIPGHNMTAATIGCLILWFGWFGFNPGSTMAVNAKLIAHCAVTTNLAAAIATLTATATAWLIIGKPDIGMTLNGCLAGLVAITAGCAFVSIEASLVIGAIAGVIVVLGVIGFDKIGIDDPVGATSVHLLNGVFGTIAIGLWGNSDLIPATNAGGTAGLFNGGGTQLLFVQLTGVLYTAGYVIVASAVAWLVIKAVFGMRVSAEEEMEGLDIGEHGNEAYHGFQMISPEIMTGGAEPKAAALPKDGKKRFSVVVEGLPADKIATIWGDLCQPAKKPSPDFLAVYPKMTLLSGNRFKFIDGNPEQVSAHLAKVLQAGANGGAVKTFVEK